jgi:hypothetical protein
MFTAGHSNFNIVITDYGCVICDVAGQGVPSQDGEGRGGRAGQ